MPSPKNQKMSKGSAYIALILAMFFAFLFGVTSNANSATPKAETKISENKEALEKTLKRYRANRMASMDLVQKIKSVLGKEKLYKGKAFLSRTKFRLESTEPEKTTVIYDGKQLWKVTELPEEMGGELQVAKTTVQGKTDEFFFVAYLLNRSSILSEATLVSDKSEGDLKAYAIKNDKMSAKDLIVTVNGKDRKIVALQFKDEVDNETFVEFSNIEFHKSSDETKFKYTPPKGVKAMEL